jgi:hypothetical protein
LIHGKPSEIKFVPSKVSTVSTPAMAVVGDGVTDTNVVCGPTVETQMVVW